jgi:hypothetical protein
VGASASIAPAGLVITDATGTALVGGSALIAPAGLVITDATGTALVGASASIAAAGLVITDALGTAAATSTAAISTAGIAITEATGQAQTAGGLILIASPLAITDVLGVAPATVAIQVSSSGLAITEALGLALGVGGAVVQAAGIEILFSMPRTTPYQQIRQAVYARLMATSGVTELVGGRMFFGALPQSINLADGPALSYQVITRPYGHTLKGSDGTSRARVQISAHSYSEAISNQIMVAVNDAFDGYRGLMGEIDVTVSILKGRADIPAPPFASTDQWTFSVSADYLINHRVTFPDALT